jgi:GT2 family glycosyltransferase
VQYFLEQCLYSVTRACTNIDAEIFVIDNNSSDNSKTFFSDKFPSVKFVWNTENIGFAKANNQAVQLCTGKYILFLNPDTILPEDCFTKCIGYAESTTNIGAMGIKMIDGSGNFLKESKRGFPSPFASLCKLSGLATIFPHSKVFAKYYLGDLGKNSDHEIDVVSGAFMMVPKKVMDVVGVFDETFFMYGEDIDLSYRIQKAG